VGKSQAASAAFHSSDRVDIRIPSLPVLNWRFLIFSAKLDAPNGDRRVVESFEPQHRPNPLFHSPVILFDQVV